MPYINFVILMGNLTRNPELRYTSDGTPVTDFGLAVNKQSKKHKDDPLFIDCTVWRKAAEAVSQYLKKGSSVTVMGELKLDRWEKDGQKRSKIRLTASNVQFMDRKGDRQNNDDEDRSSNDRPPRDNGDDIPF